jgi:hypothetical protein
MALFKSAFVGKVEDNSMPLVAGADQATKFW